MTALIQLSAWALVGQAESGVVETLGPESVRIQSVWDFVLKGGWMMIPIGLCSLVMLTVVAERLISLRRQDHSVKDQRVAVVPLVGRPLPRA